MISIYDVNDFYEWLKKLSGGHEKRKIDMKKIYSYMLLCLVIFALCGCSHRESEKKVKVSVRDAFSLDGVYQQKYDNLIIPDRLSLKQRDLYTMECQIPDYDNKKLSGEIRKVLKKEYQIDLKKDIENEEGTYPYGPAYTSGNMYIAAGCTGFYTENLSNETFTMFDRSNQIEKEYDVEKGYQDEAVKLADGSRMKVSEIQKIAQGYLDDRLTILGIAKNDSLKITKIYVVQPENAKSYVCVWLENVINGITVFDISDSREALEGKYVPCYGGELIITGKNKIVSGTLYNSGALEIIHKKTKQDKVISAKDAVALLSKTLSKNTKYHVKSIDVKYLAAYKKNMQLENPSRYKGQKIHKKDASWSLTCSYDVFALNPYWIITLDDTFQKEIVGLVNCLDGQVKFICNQ